MMDHSPPERNAATSDGQRRGRARVLQVLRQRHQLCLLEPEADTLERVADEDVDLSPALLQRKLIKAVLL